MDIDIVYSDLWSLKISLNYLSTILFVSIFLFIYIIQLERKLIPNLPANVIIALDSASCHNAQDTRPPSFNSKKDINEVWLYTPGLRYAEFKVYPPNSILAR
jgi:hypothetical protein